jgi:murein DD-endopeptidase MepM/ murein hydrolase activator NlpD
MDSRSLSSPEHWPMLVDVLKLAPVPSRANLVWILFAVGIGVQGIALRLAAHRSRPAVVGHEDATDIVVSATPAGQFAESLELPDLSEPIAGAEVPSSPDHLPGAAREYRGGVHEGVDFRCHAGEPVHASADGWVLSIEDEPNLPEAQRNELLLTCRELGATPPEVLRVMHGRRVTLWHETSPGHLLTTSYSHLSAIRPDLKPGMRVLEHEVIGAAGASGTSHAYERNTWSEVHFELRFDGQPLGLGLRPAQAGELYRRSFGEGR